jgi:hypothetical protein
MDDRTGFRRRVRMIGLFFSVIALVAVGVTVLADNHNSGFGRTVTRGEQIFLLGPAALICGAQTIGYLSDRDRQEQFKHDRDIARRRVSGARNGKLRV